jgi:enoyl-[acyl-carrier-protein] reductase (NADH)
MGFLAGKRILITGLLSNRSISYGIAKAMHREGAELAFTYQSERFPGSRHQDGCRVRQQAGVCL